MSTPHKTLEGIEVKVGQIWQDCDKRMGERKRIVVRIEGDKAVMGEPRTPSLFQTKVSIRRMYTHSTGWKLIKDAP